MEMAIAGFIAFIVCGLLVWLSYITRDDQDDDRFY